MPLQLLSPPTSLTPDCLIAKGGSYSRMARTRLRQRVKASKGRLAKRMIGGDLSGSSTVTVSGPITTRLSGYTLNVYTNGKRASGASVNTASRLLVNQKVSGAAASGADDLSSDSDSDGNSSSSDDSETPSGATSGANNNSGNSSWFSFGSSKNNKSVASGANSSKNVNSSSWWPFSGGRRKNTRTRKSKTRRAHKSKAKRITRKAYRR